MKNKEIIQKLYESFASGDAKTIASIFHQDIEWQQMEGFPKGGKHIGIDAVFQDVFAQFSSYWEGWGAVAEEFYAVDDKVFVLGYYKGKSIETGKRMEAPLVHLYTLKDGLITHFKQYTDTHVVQSALSHD